MRAGRRAVGRVRALEDERASAGTRCHAVAAVHRPTGTLAAYTALLVRPRPGGLVGQGDTLVLREHRGHRLGLRVKVANLVHLAGTDPDARMVVTWNAQENVHMLAINVALGFRPPGGMSSWQRENRAGRSHRSSASSRCAAVADLVRMVRRSGRRPGER